MEPAADLLIDIDRHLGLSYSPGLMAATTRALVGLLIACVSVHVSAQESALGNRDAVLVLRNGFVIRGQVTPINEMFLVSLPDGGEVRLPRVEVAFHCRDLEDAYQRQREALVGDSVEDRLKLAEWCLRHELLARAADQLLVAFQQEPSHPRLRLLERRLFALGGQPDELVEEAAALTAIPPPVPPTVTNRLSAEAMTQYSTVIQPILFNRCATHACHGNGSHARYRLIRPALGHATTSRMTQRNLQQTLSYIDSQRPENSPLLIQAAMGHGGAVEPPFSEKQKNQLELLEAWLRRVAITPASAVATNSGGPERFRTAAKPAAQTQTPTVKAMPNASSVVPAQHVAPAGASPSPSAAQPVPGPSQPNFEAASPTGDPFDPEIFNRRYHAEPAPTQSQAQ